MKAPVATMNSSRPRQRGSEESEDGGVHVAMNPARSNPGGSTQSVGVRAASGAGQGTRKAK
jgi:hypothetical protein